MCSSLPKIIRGLLSKPKVGAATILDAEPSFKTKGHLGRYAGVPVQHA
jgi:hypothetical protein